MRVAVGIVGDLVEAVKQRIDDGKREMIELVAGEITEFWQVGHESAGTRRP
jgi:hypothetical protein